MTAPEELLSAKYRGWTAMIHMKISLRTHWTRPVSTLARAIDTLETASAVEGAFSLEMIVGMFKTTVHAPYHSNGWLETGRLADIRMRLSASQAQCRVRWAGLEKPLQAVPSRNRVPRRKTFEKTRRKRKAPPG